MTSFTDQELLAHLQDLQNFCKFLTRDPVKAEDLCQDTLCKALGSRDNFQNDNLKAWLFTIARNRFYDTSKRERRMLSTDPTRIDFVRDKSSKDLTSTPLAALEVKEGLLSLKFISADQRDALVAVGLGGDQYDEYAEKAGIAVGTVKSRVSRARAALVDMRDDFFSATGKTHGLSTALNHLKDTEVKAQTPSPTREILPGIMIG